MRVALLGCSVLLSSWVLQNDKAGLQQIQASACRCWLVSCVAWLPAAHSMLSCAATYIPLDPPPDPLLGVFTCQGAVRGAASAAPRRHVHLHRACASPQPSHAWRHAAALGEAPACRQCAVHGSCVCVAPLQIGPGAGTAQRLPAVGCFLLHLWLPAPCLHAPCPRARAPHQRCRRHRLCVASRRAATWTGTAWRPSGQQASLLCRPMSLICRCRVRWLFLGRMCVGQRSNDGCSRLAEPAGGVGSVRLDPAAGHHWHATSCGACVGLHGPHSLPVMCARLSSASKSIIMVTNQPLVAFRGTTEDSFGRQVAKCVQRARAQLCRDQDLCYNITTLRGRQAGAKTGRRWYWRRLAAHLWSME